jgi:hypothetical protein
MEKLMAFLTVRDELEKRIGNYDSYKDLHQMKVLREQLLKNNELIKKELNRIGALSIASREDIVVGDIDTRIRTNIDNLVGISKAIRDDDFRFLFLNDDLDIFIKSIVGNEVYGKSLINKEITINKNDILGYLVPSRILEKENKKHL